MTADFNKPTTTSNYTSFPSEIRDNVNASLTQLTGVTNSQGTAQNVPTNAIQWDSTNKRWNYWDGNSFEQLVSTTEVMNLNCRLKIQVLRIDDASGDQGRIELGSATNGDLKILHTGTYSQWDNNTGDSYFDSAVDFYLRVNGNVNAVKAFGGGRTILYHNGNERFETGDTENHSKVALKVTGTGSSGTGNFTCDEEAAITAGASNNLSSKLRIGKGRTSNSGSLIDFISAANETNYNAKISRNSGVAGDFHIINKNNGTLFITQENGSDIQLQTNDTTAFTVDGTQQIGVGTTSPDSFFHIQKGSSSSDTSSSGYTLKLENSDTVSLAFVSPNNKYNKIAFRDEDSIFDGGFIVFDHTDNSMQIDADNILNHASLHITSDSFLGMGTSSPTNLLHIKDTDYYSSLIKLESYSPGIRFIDLSTTSTNGKDAEIYMNNNALKFCIGDDAGNFDGNGTALRLTEVFAVNSVGALQVNSSYGSSGQVLKTQGDGATAYWGSPNTSVPNASDVMQSTDTQDVDWNSSNTYTDVLSTSIVKQQSGSNLLVMLKLNMETQGDMATSSFDGRWAKVHIRIRRALGTASKTEVGNPLQLDHLKPAATNGAGQIWSNHFAGMDFINVVSGTGTVHYYCSIYVERHNGVGNNLPNPLLNVLEGSSLVVLEV